MSFLIPAAVALSKDSGTRVFGILLLCAKLSWRKWKKNVHRYQYMERHILLRFVQWFVSICVLPHTRQIRDACRRPDDDFMLKSVFLRASFEISTSCVCVKLNWESNVIRFFPFLSRATASRNWPMRIFFATARPLRHSFFCCRRFYQNNFFMDYQ